MLRAQLIHPRLGGGAVGDGFDAGKEAAFADFQRMGDGVSKTVHGARITR